MKLAIGVSRIKSAGLRNGDTALATRDQRILLYVGRLCATPVREVDYTSPRVTGTKAPMTWRGD